MTMILQRPNLDDLLAQLRQQLPALAEEFHVQSLGVFGSYVRQEQGPDSDLDVLITFDELPGLFRFIELEQHLAMVLGVKVDLVMKDALKPAIGKHVLNEVVPV